VVWRAIEEHREVTRIIQQQLEQINNQLGAVLQVDDDKNLNNGVNQVGAGRPKTTH